MLRYKAISILFLIYLSACSSLKNANQVKELKAISQVLDNFNEGAATANASLFFDQMAEDAYYIGTDPGELWTKQEMESWAIPYFQKGKGWDFREESERNIYLSPDGHTAWYNALAKTWMGKCRISGILEKQSGKWKIKQYHLSVAVPNDKIKDYIRLLPKEDLLKTP